MPFAIVNLFYITEATFQLFSKLQVTVTSCVIIRPILHLITSAFQLMEQNLHNFTSETYVK